MTIIENGREVAVSAPRASITETMASKYGMSAGPFESTVRAMCSPAGKSLTREEFATFLLTANKYNLNPLMREIYALPKKGGGIIPTVSIDGWMHLANAQPAFDGMEFETAFDSTGNLFSVTCAVHRKDRLHPVRITELLSECIRETEPWKTMPNRMLRHKAAIQATRYAFGFSAIYDEDEAGRFAQEASPAWRERVSRAIPFQEPPPEVNVPAVPRPVSELTTDEAGARLKDMLDDRKDEEAWLASLKAEADAKAKKGFHVFSQWEIKLSETEAKLLAPHIDSYRIKANYYADESE